MNSSVREKKIQHITYICVSGNIALTILKIIFGILGRSAALLADGVHSLSDLITDFVLLLGVHFASKPADDDHPYGHGKAETFSSLIIALILFFTVILICVGAVKDIVFSISGGALPEPSVLVLYIAIISIIVKEMMYKYTVKVGNEMKSQAVISNAWHHRTDAFSSIAVVIGVGAALLLGKKWFILDPITAIFVSIFILKIAYDITKISLAEMLDSAISETDIVKIKEICLGVKGVFNPHDIKTRKIGYRISIDLHIDIAKDTPFIEVHAKTSEIEKKIKQYFGAETFITIHPEPLP